jgi:hypothetical protein
VHQDAVHKRKIPVPPRWAVRGNLGKVPLLEAVEDVVITKTLVCGDPILQGDLVVELLELVLSLGRANLACY